MCSRHVRRSAFVIARCTASAVRHSGDRRSCACFSRSVNQSRFRNYYNVRVTIGSDHARYEPNKQLVRFGREAGCEFVDAAPEETF